MATFDVSALTPEQVARFWGKVVKGEGCWLWQAGKSRAGYGAFHPKHGRIVLAHRLAFMLTRGPIAAGLEVCHDCPGGDNPACVNPAHLFLGTHGDNLRDAFAKGRMRKRDTNPKCRGSKHGNSKLTEGQVVEARATYAKGGISMRALAKRYGIGQPGMWAILNGKAWAHLGGQSPA